MHNNLNWIIGRSERSIIHYVMIVTFWAQGIMHDIFERVMARG